MSAPIFRKVISLHIYPIKSCRGIDLLEMDIGERGPLYDRQWMIVDEQGLFLTQRQLPKMAQIECDIADITGSKMQIRFAGQNFSVPLSPEPDSTIRNVKVWKSELDALVIPQPDLHLALSGFLERPVWLVQFNPAVHREMIKKERPYGVGLQFADSASFLVTNTKSLQDLNSRLSTPIGIERFRPNVVVEGESPWEEDTWQALQNSSGLRLDMTYGCGRCQIINQDQKTGAAVSKEPLTELVKFRRKGNAIEFGMNAAHRLGDASQGHLKVGDELTLTMGPLL